jgi:hypothetical protein
VTPQFDQDADKLLELEEKIAAEAASMFSPAFSSLLALLHQIWPGDDADPAEKALAVSRLNTAALLLPLGDSVSVIAVGTLAAYELGIDTGISQAALQNSQLAGTFKRQLTPETQDQVSAVTQRARAQWAAGTQLLSEAPTLAHATTALVAANPGPVVARNARWLTNHASNEGLTLVGEADETSVLIWKAERDACVHCLAYQGHIRVRGGYPPGLTFGKKALHNKRVAQPPLHPNCRCTQWVIAKEAAQGIVTGLKREAQRSILRGWSVESESNVVRVDAARRLLAHNPAMPKSVKAYARSAIREGHFKRGRDFPA